MPQLWRRAGAAATAGDKAVMKTIGLIGGMSWQSTRTYYDLLNEMVAARLGGLHSAKILMRASILPGSRRPCSAVTGRRSKSARGANTD